MSSTQTESASSSVSKLFEPIQVGTVTLQHRVALPPLTRFRANIHHVPNDLVPIYYEQRASTPGTLLITEGTFITPKAGGYDNVPGIWNDEQIASWKRVADAVHAKGSFIFMQIWALGRTANGEILAREDPTFDVVSASDIQLTGHKWQSRALTTVEVKEYVQLFATAASNAVHGAGFDGVEVHGANGYLVDTFIQDVSNNRTDEYGGSIENRNRFALEVIDAIAGAVGANRAAIRLSPWGRVQDMRMADPIPQFSHLLRSLAAAHPDLAYIHVIEPRFAGYSELNNHLVEDGSNDFVRAIWAPKPLISAGGYTRRTAIEVADAKGDIVAFGRHFIANPDLPIRLRKDIPLHAYDRSGFYTAESPVGYIDQPFADEEFGTGNQL